MQKLNDHGEALGLLPALRLLLEERNVTRAAERAGVSQPSMSRALGRLRKIFGDPLLVRGPAGTMPTERARGLAAALPALLDDVERLVKPPRFDPSTATGSFTIVTADYVSLVLLPAIVKRVRREAPGLELDIRNVSGLEGAELLATSIDLAIGAIEEGGASLLRQSLFEDDFACLMPRGWRKPGRGGLTVAEYAALPHALITITGRGAGRADAALERLGFARRIVLRTPSFLGAPWMIADSDVALTAPRLLAEMIAPMAGLAVADVPVDLGRIVMSQFWHARRDKDPAHAWLRQLVAAEARELGRHSGRKRRAVPQRVRPV